MIRFPEDIIVEMLAGGLPIGTKLLPVTADRVRDDGKWVVPDFGAERAHVMHGLLLAIEAKKPVALLIARTFANSGADLELALHESRAGCVTTIKAYNGDRQTVAVEDAPSAWFAPHKSHKKKAVDNAEPATKEVADMAASDVRLCPGCHAPLAANGTIAFDPDGGFVVGNGHAAQFTATEAAVFGALYEARPRIISKEAMIAIVYGHLPGADEPAIKIVDVMICKVRAKIKGIGIKIDTSWGKGYRLIIEGNHHE